MKLLRTLIITVVVVSVALLGGHSAVAQSRSLRWERWDAEFLINEDGSVDVAETYVISFIGGPFTFGNAEIFRNQLEALTDFAVYEDGEAYEPAATGASFTYDARELSDSYIVDWYYPETSNQTRTFVLEYTILGGLIIEDSGFFGARRVEPGDRFFWKAVRDHAAPIESSVVTITLPPGASVDTTVVPPTSFGPDADVTISGDGSVIRFEAQNIPTGQEFEVGVRWPHGFVTAPAPSWQSQYVFEQTVTPIINLGLGALGVAILLAGSVGVYLVWFTFGRDPKVGAVPSYLTSPPSGLPPGLVGSLVDEKADLQDIIATLIDLGHRGFLRMEEGKKRLTGRQFTFHRTDASDESLLPFEKRLVNSVFGRQESVELDDLREKFYSSIPSIEKAMYSELVSRGFFPSSPKATRSKWQGIGALLLFGTAGVGFLLAAFLFEMYPAIVCPLVGAGVASFVLIFAARAMPTKTEAGALEAKKWDAFKAYLDDIENYEDLESVTGKFEEYLAYAVAFGLERAFVRKFSRVETTPIPRWYVPVGIPVGRGGTLAQGGPTLGGGGPDVFGGLNSISDGLFSMLNTTSTVFTSVPSSSGSGSSGSFSGGGFSGGGFSGGFGGGGGSTGFG